MSDKLRELIKGYAHKMAVMGSAANDPIAVLHATEPLMEKLLILFAEQVLEEVEKLIELRNVPFGKKVYFAGFSMQGNSRVAQAMQREEKLKAAIRALASRETEREAK
jgi:hypothetical protein